MTQEQILKLAKYHFKSGWIATDEDMETYWYEAKPIMNITEWDAYPDEYKLLCTQTELDCDWTESLVKL